MVAGKTIVVTGSGDGLGRAYAQALARAEARVVVNDVNPTAAARVAQGILDSGGEALSVPGSVASWDDAQTLIISAQQWHGRLDGVVNNAGILHFGAWADETEESLRRIVEVNVLGSMFVSVHAVRAMQEASTPGVILNVTSGAHLGMPHLTAYGSTKGSIASLTYGLSLESEASGVRVNALSPLAATSIGGATPSASANMPTPEQIAPAVVYLMSDEASALNGQVVRFDGRSIGLLTAPHFGEAAVDDVHSVEDIRRAFAEILNDRVHEPGFGRR